MTLATWHFHIEISSKCTLRCPRCARQEVPDTLVNTELDLAFFQRNFSPEFVKNNIEKITFCGDDGDPIYAHDLVPVIAYFKAIKPLEIVIVTNGSHRKSQWWQDLAGVLTDQDTVHFSIDGWDDSSNNQYRVNSNFDSIEQGIKTLIANSNCRTVWAAIAFKFNQHKLHEMSDMAQTWGMDAFQLTKSTKFGKVYASYGSNDHLQPSDSFISSSFRFERTLTAFKARATNTVHPINLKLYEDSRSFGNVKPLCFVGNKGLYIDAQGRLFPCCWVANRYAHNAQWQHLAQQFDLHQRTLTDALADNFWREKFQSFEWQECHSKCSTQRVNKNYATEW